MVHSWEKVQKQHYRKKSIRSTPIYWGLLRLSKGCEYVPCKKPAKRINLLNISERYHKLTPLGKQNPKNLFEEVSHESLPGNPVLGGVPQTPFEKKIPSELTTPPSQNSPNILKNENCSLYPLTKSFLSSPTWQKATNNSPSIPAIPTSVPSSISSRIITIPPFRTPATTRWWGNFSRIRKSLNGKFWKKRSWMKLFSEQSNQGIDWYWN